MLLPTTDADRLSPEMDESRFTKLFCTDPQGPVNPLVVQEQQLRQLAQELVRHSPELAKKLAESR